MQCIQDLTAHTILLQHKGSRGNRELLKSSRLVLSGDVDDEIHDTVRVSILVVFRDKVR